MLEILFGSKARAKLLEWLFSHPDEQFYIRQLESLLGLDSAHIGKELNKLQKLGIVSLKEFGNQKHYSVNEESSVYSDLKGIVTKLSIPVGIIRSALEPVRDRIDIAFIFGSFARDQFNSTSDLDLMVIGEVTLRDIASLIRQIGRCIGREVNATCYSPCEYRISQSKNNFLVRVSKGDKIFVIGNESDFRTMAQTEPLA